jgi:hypothetical protein
VEGGLAASIGEGQVSFVADEAVYRLGIGA